jgi:His-Xaa-Ser system radical SAM maturase HxsC
MRRLAAQWDADIPSRSVWRVTALDDVACEWSPDHRILVLTASPEQRLAVETLRQAGLTALRWVACEGLLAGDVVVALAAQSQAIVVFRESDTHHSLLLTNRCNSNCLMCSQPPTPQDDAWLVGEALEIIRHIRTSPTVLGLSGGEPLLLGGDLRRVMDAVEQHHPRTRIELLTNGRLLGNPARAAQALDGLTAQVTWLVPLYGHADFLHDFVVQAPGAFEETIAGLLALQARRQPVQLRIVLIEPVLQALPELCAFIGRNLPFVSTVALMGCEPIGFALANRAHCEVDLAAWSDALAQAARILRRHAVPFVWMNIPLCALPRPLWPEARRSISDWKNVYTQECLRCSVKDACSGLFAWHEQGWKPTTIQAIGEMSA